MNTYAEDKENFNPVGNEYNITRKARGFSALLEDATKENEHELNFSVAVKTQCQDINCLVDKLVHDFQQEDKDSKYARELHDAELAAERQRAQRKHLCEHKDEHTAKELHRQELEEQREFLRERMTAEHKDESAALKVAMQERREVQLRAQSKREMEAKDCEYAKQTILDDLALHQEMEEKCSGDEKLARELKKQLDEEMNAEMKQGKEEEDIDCNVRRHEVEDETEQAIKDKQLASKLLTKSARQAYELEFSKKTKPKTDDFSMSAIAAQWENAGVIFDDVSGGICITLLLPHLADLKIKLPKSYLLSIEAHRMIMKGDKLSNKRNSCYAAEFEIRGKNVSLVNSDINYNYTSETGLLHIYVENVSLAGMATEESTSLLSSMKSSFSRLFS